MLVETTPGGGEAQQGLAAAASEDGTADRQRQQSAGWKVFGSPRGFPLGLPVTALDGQAGDFPVVEGLPGFPENLLGGG